MRDEQSADESSANIRNRHPRIEWFEALLAYRRWHTIAEASRRLGVSQDLLSERIRLLEEWFSHNLFERSLPHQRLTPKLNAYGDRYLSYMQQIVASFEDLQSVLDSPQNRGQFIVALPESLATGLLADVRNAIYNQGSLPAGGWRFITARSAVVRAEIIQKKATIGLLVEREPYIDRDLTVEPIARSPMCLFCAARHPFAHRSHRVSFDELSNEVIVVDKEMSTYRAIFESLLRRARVPVMQKDAFSNIEAVKSAVKAGPGVAMLPYFAIADEVKEGKLALVKMNNDEPVYVQILIAYHPENKLESSIMRDLMNEFRNQGKNLPKPEKDFN